MDVYRGVIVHGFIRTCVKLFDISVAILMVYTRAFNSVFKQLLFFFIQKRVVDNQFKNQNLFIISYWL